MTKEQLIEKIIQLAENIHDQRQWAENIRHCLCTSLESVLFEVTMLLND